jgi:hypothetical protein
MIKRLIFAVLPLLLLISCGSPQFSETADETGYYAEFEGFSSSSSHKLSVGEDEALAVEVSLSGGTIGLNISGEDGYEAYEGSRLSSGAFTVGLPYAGEYTVKVFGKRAGGSVKISITGGHNAAQ